MVADPPKLSDVTPDHSLVEVVVVIRFRSSLVRAIRVPHGLGKPAHPAQRDAVVAQTLCLRPAAFRPSGQRLSAARLPAAGPLDAARH